MADRRTRLEPDFDRIAVTDALSTRLAEAENEYKASQSDPEGQQLARERMVVLLGELSTASRRWSLVRIPTDPRPDLRLDETLRRLTLAELRSREQIELAQRILTKLNDQADGRRRRKLDAKGSLPGD